MQNYQDPGDIHTEVKPNLNRTAGIDWIFQSNTDTFDLDLDISESKSSNPKTNMEKSTELCEDAPKQELKFPKLQADIFKQEPKVSGSSSANSQCCIIF